MVLFQQNMSRDDTDAGSISLHGASDGFSWCHLFGNHKKGTVEWFLLWNFLLACKYSLGQGFFVQTSTGLPQLTSILT